jgi:putative RNA 2'-phosphotransferase
LSNSITKISKFLSKYLRHSPQELGLTLLPGGWVEVKALLNGCKAKNFPISMNELMIVVAQDEKGRYSFSNDNKFIRANQGHSIEVDLQLDAVYPPEFLYHGTIKDAIPSIFSEGLKKMQRHHVHLSYDVDTARAVGARRGNPVIIMIYAEEMHRHGYKFYRSENGVWLTDCVPVEYLCEALIDNKDRLVNFNDL